MDFPDRILLLKIPTLLQHQRMFLELVFVSDYVSRIGSRYLEDFYFHIINQLAAFDLRKRYFGAIFIFYLVIFTLRRDTPAVQSRTLSVGIEDHQDCAVLTTAGTQNLIHFTDLSLDLIGGDNVDVCLRIQQDRIGLFVVRR